MSKQVPVAVTAAVSKFETAREALNGFRTQHAKILETFENLKEQYNQSLNEVKALYKEHHEVIGGKLGDFSARSRVMVDAELLLKLMGPTVDPIITIKYGVERKHYDEAVSRGIIPSEVVRQVEKRTEPSIYGPKEQ